MLYFTDYSLCDRFDFIKYNKSILHLTMKKKQQRFTWYTETKYKSFTWSAGYLVKKAGIQKSFKFYKKSNKNIGVLINALQKLIPTKHFKNYKVLSCNNYNYRQYKWIKKFYFLMEPQVDYVLLRPSWNAICKKKRRVNRKYLKILIKTL